MFGSKSIGIKNVSKRVHIMAALIVEKGTLVVESAFSMSLSDFR